MFLNLPFVITFILCLIYISSRSIYFGITWLYSRNENRQSENLDITTTTTTTAAAEDQEFPAAPTEEPAFATFNYENERTLEEVINTILIWIHQNKVEQLSSVTNRMAEHQTEMSLSKSVLIELFSVYRQSRLQPMLDFMNDRNTDDVDAHKLASAIAILMMFSLGIRIDIQDQLDSPFVNSLLILRDSLQVSRDPFMCDFMLFALTEESVSSAVLLKEVTRENPNHIINYEKTPDFAFIDRFMIETQFMTLLPVIKPSLISRIPLLDRIGPAYKIMVGSSSLEKDVQLKLFEDYATDVLKDINHHQADFWINVQENFNNDDNNSTEGTRSPSPILPEYSTSIGIPQAVQQVVNFQGPLQPANTQDPLQPAANIQDPPTANITQAITAANTRGQSGHNQDAPPANTRDLQQALTEISISPLSGTPPSGSTVSSIRNIINRVKAEYPVDPPTRNVTFAPALVASPGNDTGTASSSAVPADTSGDSSNLSPVPAEGTIDNSLQNPPLNYSPSDFGIPVGALGYTVLGNTAFVDNTALSNTTSAASTSGGPATPPSENNNDSVHISSSASPAVSSSSTVVDDPLIFNDHDCEILEFNDEGREAFDRLATHPSQATFDTVSDLRMKYTEVENRLKELLIKENADIFNKMHTLRTMGATFSGVPSRLNQVIKAYKALIKQFKDFHDYIQEYERAFVFYQAHAIVDAYKTETRYFYEDAAGNTASAQVTIDELARLGGYVHKSIRMVFTLERIFEKYVACSTVFKDTYKQREYRNAIKILSDECYDYANGYKTIERAFYTREMDPYASPA